MRRRAQPLGVVDVFEAVGDAVQRPAAAAAGDLALGPPRRLARPLGGDLDEGAQLAVEGRGTRQRRLGQRKRRQIAGGDAPARLGDRLQFRAI